MIKAVSFCLLLLMTKLTIYVKCPHCISTKVKKNGKKPNGSQNFYCYSCKKQFLYEYKNKGACPKNKKLICSMTLNSSGIRDISRVLSVCSNRFKKMV